MATNSQASRKRRKTRIRKKVSGSVERPRLTVFRSNKHIYAQVIDDSSSVSLASGSDRGKSGADIAGNKVDRAKAVGAAIAEACLAKGIKKVVFDRAGYKYHGRVRALADAAREAGLDF
jgi:large subunit ribosomal protein L18